MKYTYSGCYLQTLIHGQATFVFACLNIEFKDTEYVKTLFIAKAVRC